jgi:hypothetical protein
MTTKEYNRIIHELGFSQEAAGIWLGYSPRQGQRPLCPIAGSVPRAFSFLDTDK